MLIPGRRKDQPIAATRITAGTDVDFGSLTHLLLDGLVRIGRRTQARAPRHRACKKKRDGLWHHRQPARCRRHAPRAHGALRVRRRGRRGAASAAEVGHQRDPRLRRLPDQRPVPAHRRPRDRRLSIAPRSTARRRSAPRRCRCRTSTPASSTAGPACCSARTRASRPKFLKTRFAVRPVRARSGWHNIGTLIGAGLTNLSLVWYLVGELLASSKRQAPRAAAVRARRRRSDDWRLDHRRPARADHETGCRRASRSSSSAPRWSRRPTARSPACSAPRREHRPPCRSCSTCSPSASRIGSRPGSPASRG